MIALVGLIYLVVAGLFYPAGLSPIEASMCGTNSALVTDRTALKSMRDSVDKSYAIFCRGSGSRPIVDVTSRWMLMNGSLGATALVAFIVQAKLKPPMLSSPKGPGL